MKCSAGSFCLFLGINSNIATVNIASSLCTKFSPTLKFMFSLLLLPCLCQICVITSENWKCFYLYHKCILVIMSFYNTFKFPSC
uniref:Uncharacterized protein n=1 Tax=Octopus bimaculoides TaxID=37653 RepID=A0A0L8HFH4_OCTBM